MEEINVYCDESCHLEYDKSPVMILGAVYCPKSKIREINKRIKEIKLKHGVHAVSEIKWSKVSQLKLNLYLDIIDYFFDDDDISFRCLIADKTNLNHDKYHQTHDDWYYKMYFNMLKVIFIPNNIYNIFIDIKDTHSDEKIKKLLDICRNNQYDFSGHIIQKMQPIRSNEVQIMQLTDILIGAIGYVNRFNLNDFGRNKGKIELINRIKSRSGYFLNKSTLYKEQKFNIFRWEPNYYEKYGM